MIEQVRDNTLHISFDKRFGPEFFKRIPHCTGVFWMLDRRRQLLLVGKSHNLNLKLSRFRDLLPLLCAKHHNEVELLNQIHEINWTECENLAAATMIASELIKRRNPSYQLTPVDHSQFYYLRVKIHKQHVIGHMIFEKDNAPKSYGAFKGRAHGRQVMASFFRLMWLLFRGGPASTWPLQLVKPQSPRHYQFSFPEISEVELWNWQQCIEGFFLGESPLVLKKFESQLRKSQFQLDTFTRKWLKQDLDILTKFYVNACSKNNSLRQKVKLSTPLVSPEWLEPLKITPCNKAR